MEDPDRHVTPWGRRGVPAGSLDAYTQEQLADLEREHGSLPNAPRALTSTYPPTGERGEHIYLRHPGGLPPGKLAGYEGVELTNYVVAPPSIHPSGHWPHASTPE